MTGEFEHTLDAKGRIFIPAKLREELGEVFYVTISSETCLSAYSAEAWQSFRDKVNEMSYIRQKKMRALFIHAAKCELDKQGRILLPQKLRDFANLTRDVTVLGCNNHVEFWDTETWAKVDAEETTPENIRAVFEEFDF